MAQVRSGLGALLLALVLLWTCSHGEAVVVPVSTPEEFLAALSNAAGPGAADSTVVELQKDIALSRDKAASYSLPFVVASNHTLALQAGDGMKQLDFGEIPALLFFKPGSTLLVDRLNASGADNPHLGSWPEDVNSSTVIQTFPMWPTLSADPGFAASVRDTVINLYPIEICTPEIGAAQYDALRQLARASGTNRSEIEVAGTMARLVDWAAPLPVFSPVTKVAIGTIFSAAVNTTIYCRLPDNEKDSGVPPIAPSAVVNGTSSSDGNETSGSSSGEASGAGTPAAAEESGIGGGMPCWVWVVVGVAATLTLVAFAAALVWRSRHVLRQQQQQLLVLKVDDGDGVSELASKSFKVGVGLDHMWSGSLPSAGNSGILEFHGGKTALPEGPWKSRVGFIEGLQLGGLIGRGGYARVYKGRWKGTAVAVKVAETYVGRHQQYDLRNEPLLSLSLTHPNVLQGYKMCIVKMLTEADGEHGGTQFVIPSVTGSGNLGNSGSSHGQGHSGSSSGNRIVPHLTDPSCMVEIMPADAVLEPGMYEMWLVSELADKGTLADATKAGWLSQTEPPGRNMPVILLCLLDVARGLEYLHSCSIVHGDLKPQNVLLKTAGSDRRGFVCKLGDFGLSRILQETQTHVDTGSYGTVTHAAPELLNEGRLTKASDVFAFGIVLWELVTGQRLFPDMHHMQIIVQVTQKGYRPPIPPDFPPILANLVRRCWDVDAQTRPSAHDIVQELIDFCASYGAAQRRSPMDAADRGTAGGNTAAAHLPGDSGAAGTDTRRMGGADTVTAAPDESSK